MKTLVTDWYKEGKLVVNFEIDILKSFSITVYVS